MAEYCDDGRFAVRRAVWIPQIQFRSVPGKYLGWGGESDGTEETSKTLFGCSMVRCDIESLQRALSLGYPPTLITVNISDFPFQGIMDQARALGVTNFYIDEPCHNGKPYKIDLLYQVTDYAATFGGHVFTSESDGQEEWLFNSNVRRLQHYVSLKPDPKPFVGWHTYFHQGFILGADPRVQWDFLRQYLGALFNFAWVRLREEQRFDEIGLLFGHANNMGGINKLFYGFWQDEPGWPGGEYHRLYDASLQARYNGWLQQLEKRQEQKWCCPTQIYDPEDCSLESWSWTGEERWV